MGKLILYGNLVKKLKMFNKIKIYCVLFDTLPFIEEIVLFAKKNNLKILRQVGGAFTVSSCIQMLTGKMLSDLSYHGIGYYLNRKYKDVSTGSIEWPWKQDILFDILLKNDWNINTHNSRDVKKNIYDNPLVNKTVIFKKKYEKLMLEKNKIARILEKEEKKYINKIQIKKNNTNNFYFIEYQFYHQALFLRNKDKNKFKKIQKREIERSLRIMSEWNFDEPNSLFWFFSDHGFWELQKDNRHPHPQMYLSWVLFKDNTENPIKVNSKVISIRDFFITIMNKMKYNHKLIKDICPINFFQNQNRIYYVEDGRLSINKDISTTAIACKFKNWKKGIPKELLQVSYHEPDDEWDCVLTCFDKNLFEKKSIQKKEIDKKMQQKVIERFNWIKK
jgi:hypothetical protein